MIISISSDTYSCIIPGLTIDSLKIRPTHTDRPSFFNLIEHNIEHLQVLFYLLEPISDLIPKREFVYTLLTIIIIITLSTGIFS